MVMTVRRPDSNLLGWFRVHKRVVKSVMERVVYSMISPSALTIIRNIRNCKRKPLVPQKSVVVASTWVDPKM